MPNAVEPPSTTPVSLAEAYELLADADGVPWRPLAGGTDLMVTITGEIGEPPARVLDIWRIDELRGIRDEGDALMIGALTTYTDLRRSPDVAGSSRCSPRRRQPSARHRSRTAGRSAGTW